MTEPSPKETANSRQTRTYLMELLAANGLSPRKQFGQNFLIDMNLFDLFVQSANIQKNDVILEVGSGTGGLTTRLAQLAGKVVAVEIDAGLYRLVEVAMLFSPNVTMLHMDALESKHTIAKPVLEALAKGMAELGQTSYSLVANLPYDIAAPLMINLILEELTIRSMTVTMQLEMAEKIIAEKGSEDYGPLAILIQAVGSAEIIRTLPASAFWPRPNVQSAFVRVKISETPAIPRSDWNGFHELVRELFLYRRKNLRAALGKIDRLKPIHNERDQILAKAGLDAGLRAEQLSALQLYAVYLAVSGRS